MASVEGERSAYLPKKSTKCTYMLKYLHHSGDLSLLKMNLWFLYSIAKHAYLYAVCLIQ